MVFLYRRSEICDMNLENVYAWFRRYATSFYCDDDTVMAGIRLKEEHTIRVAEISAALAAHLGLNEAQRQLAAVIGVGHDVGRFIQYSRYRTFNDALSVDHGELSIKEMKRERVFDGLMPDDRETAIFAIYYHNKLSFPEDSPELSLFARIIRDADKLDIFRCLPPVTADHDYSPVLLERLVQGKSLPYAEVKTAADRRLVRIGWLLDVNYPWTLRILKQEGHIDNLLEQLPADTVFRGIKEQVGCCLRQKMG